MNFRDYNITGLDMQLAGATMFLGYYHADKERFISDEGIEFTYDQLIRFEAHYLNPYDIKGGSMNNYEIKVGNRIKEMRNVTLNNIPLKENIDFIILDDRQTIRFVSEKAKTIRFVSEKAKEAMKLRGEVRHEMD